MKFNEFIPNENTLFDKKYPPYVMENTDKYNPSFINNYKDRSIYDSSCFIFWAPVIDRVIPNVCPFRYWVSTTGLIFDRWKGSYIGSLHTKGYIQAHFCTTLGTNITRKIHRVVMTTFCYFEGCELYEVNHKDGVKSNNNITNLEWSTHSENTIHAINMGLKTIFGNAGKVVLDDNDVKEIIELSNIMNYDQIQEYLSNKGKNISKHSISNILYGRNRKSYYNDLYNVKS